MGDKVSLERTVAVLEAVALELEAAKDMLGELDSAIGDGDIGISTSRGFKALRDGLAEHPADIGRLLMKSGTDFGEAAGATIGALLGTAFMRAGKVVIGQSELTLPDVARMVAAAEQGIKERGKAEPGNKTILDALMPARLALERAVERGLGPREAARLAMEAAEKGMIATIGMKSAFGRSRWLAERSVGHQDPGATIIYLMSKAVVDYMDRAGA
ncbi:MAG: dihydroxyacetone kinase subunit DhaL [Sphingomonadaceae bacterium]